MDPENLEFINALLEQDVDLREVIALTERFSRRLERVSTCFIPENQRSSERVR